MKTNVTRFISLGALSITLTGCLYDFSGSSSSQPVGTTGEEAIQVTTKNVGNGDPLGGYLEQYMDQNDQFKLSRGLDSALGKSTTWTNPVNGAEFTVTPVNKVNMAGSKYCRTYRLTMAKKGSKDQVSGTACIGADGSWHVV